MKYIFYILISTLLLSCVNSEQEFSEKDAYDLLNNHFIKDITENNQEIVLNEFQLSADFSSVNFNLYMKLEESDNIDDEIPEVVIITESEVFPERFTKKEWSQDKLSAVRILNNSIFQRQADSILPKEFLMDKYGTNVIHNVSYPFYGAKNKIAIIIDESETVGKMECVRIGQCYIYIKENNHWKSLKEYGTMSIQLTLQNYLNDTSI